MVFTMESDGSLSPSNSQDRFARNYNDGVGQGHPDAPLHIFGDSGKPAHEPEDGTFRVAAVAPRIAVPRPDILTAIDETALRYASHQGLRAAGLTVTEWRLLFRANIEIESAYNPNARSRVGAIGLGQLMPGTAERLGVDPRDWRANLDGSARYLAERVRCINVRGLLRSSLSLSDHAATGNRLAMKAISLITPVSQFSNWPFRMVRKVSMPASAALAPASVWNPRMGRKRCFSAA